MPGRRQRAGGCQDERARETGQRRGRGADSVGAIVRVRFLLLFKHAGGRQSHSASARVLHHRAPRCAGSVTVVEQIELSARVHARRAEQLIHMLSARQPRAWRVASKETGLTRVSRGWRGFTTARRSVWQYIKEIITALFGQLRIILGTRAKKGQSEQSSRRAPAHLCTLRGITSGRLPTPPSSSRSFLCSLASLLPLQSLSSRLCRLCDGRSVLLQMAVQTLPKDAAGSM